MSFSERVFAFVAFQSPMFMLSCRMVVGGFGDELEELLCGVLGGAFVSVFVKLKSDVAFPADEYELIELSAFKDFLGVAQVMYLGSFSVADAADSFVASVDCPSDVLPEVGGKVFGVGREDKRPGYERYLCGNYAFPWRIWLGDGWIWCNRSWFIPLSACQ